MTSVVFILNSYILMALVVLGQSQISFNDVWQTPRTVVIDETTDMTALPRGKKLIDRSVVIQASYCNQTIDHMASLTDVFSTVIDIHGSLQIFVGPCFTSFSFFDNLRIIRGNGDKGLEIRSTLVNLENITWGFNNLTTVLNNVEIHNIDNPFCSQEPSFIYSGVYQGFDFQRLVPGSIVMSYATSTTIVMLKTTLNDNGDLITVNIPYRECRSKICDSFCSVGCSSPNDASACQSDCPSQCGSRGCQDSSSTCCDVGCLGGCSGAACVACQDGYFQTDTGECVQACPTGTYKFGWVLEPLPNCENAYNRVVQPYSCVSQCEGGTGLVNDTCEVLCPGAMNPVSGICPPVPDYLKDFKVCEGIFDLTESCQLPIIEAQNCDTLVGSLIVTKATSISEATDINMSKLQQLRRVTGGIKIVESTYTSLNFFENVEYIDGILPQGFNEVLDVSNNVQLKTLGLTQLRYMGTGNVLLRNNPLLCLHDTIDWDRLMPNYDTSFLTMDFTKDFFDDHKSTIFAGLEWSQLEFAEKNPVACNGVSCAPNCGSSCWNTDDDTCQRCPIDLLLESDSCVSTCSDGYFQENNWQCLKCHSSCTDCYGPNSTECSACDTNYFLNGTSCVDVCGIGFYGDAINGKCAECSSKCLSCYGPVDNECTSCENDKVLDLQSDSCVTECPPDFFEAEGQFIGKQCQGCRQCRDGLEYISRNCTKEYDRICTTCTVCSFPSEFRSRSCTLTSDTECQAIQTCKADEFESQRSSITSDRICSPISQCTNGTYEIEPATSTSNRVCSNCSSCPIGFIPVGGCNSTSDTVCEPGQGCQSFPCQNNGQCESTSSSPFFSCTCTSGFTGTFCDEPQNTSKDFSIAVVAGAAGGSVVLICVVLLILFFVKRSKEAETTENGTSDNEFSVQNYTPNMAFVGVYDTSRDLVPESQAGGQNFENDSKRMSVTISDEVMLSSRTSSSEDLTQEFIPTCIPEERNDVDNPSDDMVQEASVDNVIGREDIQVDDEFGDFGDHL